MGYLPDALVNFLALLGWTPEGDQEIFSRDELIEQFTLDRVAKNPAVFDIEKLNWINFHYMKQLDEDQLYAVCLPHLQKAGYASENPDEKEAAWLKAICAAMREHVQYGAQIVDAAKVKGKFVYMPIRVAVTGVMHGPDLNVIVALMGRDKVLARLDETLA